MVHQPRFDAGLLALHLLEIYRLHVIASFVNEGLCDHGQVLIKLLVGDLDIVNVEVVPEHGLVLLLALLDVGHEEVGDPGQVLHLAALARLLCRDPLHHEVEPLPDAGEQRGLHLQHDVVPGPPLEGVDDVEALEDRLQLGQVLARVVTDVQTVLPGNRKCIFL